MAETPTAPVTNTAAASQTAPTTTPAPEAAKPAAAPEAQKPAAEMTQAQKVAEIRRLKLKMDGHELDLPEDEVIRLAQQAGVSAKRFQEAAALRKQAETVLEMIQKQPNEVLKKVMDPKAYRQMLEDELTEMVKRDAETPEAKKIREQEERLRAYEQRERESTEAAEKKKQEEEKSAKEKIEAEKTQKYMKEYEGLFSEALEKSGLPKNAYTVRRMAELQKVNLKKGFNLDPASLSKIVRQDYEAELKHWIGDTDGDKLMDMLGEDAVKKLSKAQIKKLKAATAQKFSAPTPEPQQEQTKPQVSSWREFSKRKRQLS